MATISFVITGAPRSGTHYTAELLSAAGLRVGHEQLFELAPRLGCKERLGRSTFRSWLSKARMEAKWLTSPLDGDVSWLAVPYLDRFDGAVLLQLRDPLKVVASMSAMAFLRVEPSSGMWLYDVFAKGSKDWSGDPLKARMGWLIEWIDHAMQYADFTYRVEDLGNEETLARILRLTGVDDVAAGARSALTRVDPGTNAGTSVGRPPPSLTWDDLPPGPEKNDLEELAREWGYL